MAKKDRLFKAADKYKLNPVNYCDDYNAFKTKRIILIEIYKYSPHEKLKQRTMMKKISHHIDDVARRAPQANWVIVGSECAIQLEEVLNEIYNRDEEDDIENNDIEEDLWE
jgi:hypothetical protein